MRVAALITGGKDSTLALYRALRQGHQVEWLVAMMPRREDSWMFHYPNIHVTDLFAEAVGIPLVRAPTSGVREEEVEDLKRVLSTLDVDGVVSGAVYSQYQKSRIDRVCRELHLKSITPLWHENPLKLLREMLNLHFEIVIVGVYAYGLGPSWLGRRLDEQAVQELIELNRRYQVSLIGEGGEYESLVLDAPIFKRRIQILRSEVIWRGDSGHLLVKEARLVEK